jgi:hypothetical protein
MNQTPGDAVFGGKRLVRAFLAAVLLIVSASLLAAPPIRAVEHNKKPAVIKNLCVPAVITAQPTSTPLWIPLNSSSVLSVIVAGTDPVTVTWTTDAGAVVGSGANLPVSPLVHTCYHALVNNGCQVTESEDVWVMVSTPAITQDATVIPSTIKAGDKVTLEAGGGNGLGPLTYKWYLSDGTFVGNGKKLVLRPTVTTSYYYKLCNSTDSGPSNTVTVTVQ